MQATGNIMIEFGRRKMICPNGSWKPAIQEELSQLKAEHSKDLERESRTRSKFEHMDLHSAIEECSDVAFPNLLEYIAIL